MSSSKKTKAKSAKGKTKAKQAPKKKAAAKPMKAEKAEEVEKEEKPKSEKKETPPKTAVKREAVNLGTPPTSMIGSRHLDSMHERPGRGFSFGELSSAGVPRDAAARARLSVDIRRRSVIESNVDALKSWYGQDAQGTEAKAALVAAARKK